MILIKYTTNSNLRFVNYLNIVENVVMAIYNCIFFLQYVAFEKVTKRLTTDIMSSRKTVDNLKEKTNEIYTKATEAQDKYKSMEIELEEFRNTVGSANQQKESLSYLAKVIIISHMR